MKRHVAVCEACGAKRQMYVRVLRPRMVPLLRALADQGRPMRLRDVPGVNASTYPDFQRLHLWGLIREADVSGRWQVTELGLAWLQRRATVREKVWTYRNRLAMPPSGEEVREVCVFDLEAAPRLPERPVPVRPPMEGQQMRLFA